MDGSPPSSFEGDYIHPNTTTRFTATLGNRLKFKFKFKYTMQLRDERKNEKRRALHSFACASTTCASSRPATEESTFRENQI